MNLKEAFRFQNKLQRLMGEAENVLSHAPNLVQVETTHLRKKATAEAENEVVLQEPTTEFAQQINQMADFLLHLLDQHMLLAAAIHRSKAGLELDMDAEAGLNNRRQAIAQVFRNMANLRASESLLPGGGTGYRFNAEGNQVPYRYDVKRVTTIHFDRKKIRSMASMLHQRADAVSAQLDSYMVNTPVEYVTPFDVNDTFAEVFQQYCGT